MANGIQTESKWIFYLKLHARESGIGWKVGAEPPLELKFDNPLYCLLGENQDHS